MNILVTGAHGFLGKHLSEYYSSTGHNVYALGRKQLDIVNHDHVTNFFDNNDIDVVLHAAVKGGARGEKDTYEDLVANLQMFRNLKEQSDKFRVMISFGSGAEFDRRSAIIRAREEDIFISHPEDYYGLAKNIIAREIIGFDGNIINLRLFGCFGSYEKETRMIKGNVIKAKNTGKIVIHQNKMMDFFCVNDLCKVVDNIIDSPSAFAYRDLNMCYRDKRSLVDVAEIIVNNLQKDDIRVILNKEDMDMSYTGCSAKLESIGIPFDGLENGIKEVVKNYVR